MEIGIDETVHTPKYDILRETWIYQEIKQEVETEGREHFLESQRQLLIDIVDARFPRLVLLAKTVAPSIAEVPTIHSLILCISKARLEKEARQSLTDAVPQG